MKINTFLFVSLYNYYFKKKIGLISAVVFKLNAKIRKDVTNHYGVQEETELTMSHFTNESKTQGRCWEGFKGTMMAVMQMQVPDKMVSSRQDGRQQVR